MTSATELSGAILEASEVEIGPISFYIAKFKFFFKFVRFGLHQISTFFGLQTACRWYHPIVQLPLRIWIGSTLAAAIKRPILEASEVEIGPTLFFKIRRFFKLVGFFFN